MSIGSRSTPALRWWTLGVVGILLVVCGITAPIWSSPIDAHPSAEASPAAGSSAVLSGDEAMSASEDEQFDIPPGATDDERLRIKLSFDIVSVPVDRRDEVLSLPGVTVAAPVTLGDTVFFAVPGAGADLVRAAIPDATVEDNPLVTAKADETPVPSWGLDVVDNTSSVQDDHYLFDSTGAGVTAFVIDTGVQASHPDFGGRVDAAAGKDFVGDGQGTNDCNGHGTHVAGTIGSTTFGVAKDVRIIPVRVLGCTGQGSGYDVFRALAWISDNFPGTRSVINMSVGMPRWDPVNNAVNALSDEGFVSAVAAGNDTKDACGYSPASASDAITTGAYDSSNKLAYYSNIGPCVSILAPGSGIVSTWINSQAAIDSGTSMASPHVAGLTARLLQEHPTWKTGDVKNFFSTAAARGHISGVPSGTVNLVAAIPGIPRMASLTATTDAAGMALSWSTNDIGTFVSFSITVTDTTTGRSFPVTVSALRTSTVFTDVAAGHAYTVSITGSARMPSGAVVATDALTATGP
ncbi:S8 family peptidase [Microbacterium testaceum]|uniref:S8 family peptidase n=1 Tax=Microbacterium testaceum TaxID=2033 RepID=UPI00382331AC